MKNNPKKLPLAETFVSIQGEGNYAGKKVVFIRFSGCDFRCAWCDSKYTHMVTDETEYLNTDALLLRVREVNGEGVINNSGRNADHIVITGGNPALYDLEEFVVGLHEMGMKVHIETQGSKWPSWLKYVDNVVFSPKPPSSKMKVNQLWLANKINEFAKYKMINKEVIVKIPIFDDIDYDWAKMFYTMLDMSNIDHYFLSVGNHNPHGDDKTRTVVEGVLNGYAWLVDKVLKDKEYTNISVLPQLHSLLWGNTTGV